MRCRFLCAQRELFELSQRVAAPLLQLGAMLRHSERHYTILDLEYVAVPDGGQDRCRLETLVYLRELSGAEVEDRRGRQRTPSVTPRRY